MVVGTTIIKTEAKCIGSFDKKLSPSIKIMIIWVNIIGNEKDKHMLLTLKEPTKRWINQTTLRLVDSRKKR